LEIVLDPQDNGDPERIPMELGPGTPFVYDLDALAFSSRSSPNVGFVGSGVMAELDRRSATEASILDSQSSC
jgi:hypothetical protein